MKSYIRESFDGNMLYATDQILKINLHLFQIDSFAIGDWNISPRVESAYISGSALGEYLNETRL